MSFPKPTEFSEAVVVYETTFCSYCRMAKALLERKGIPFARYDVGGDREARQWLVEMSGQRTVPQIFVRGEAIGGYQELAAMDRSGALNEALAS